MTSSKSQLISTYHLPFGDYPHAEGLQQLNQESANKLVAHFLQKRSCWPRWWHQLPVYKEHPDEFQWPFKRHSFLQYFQRKTIRQFLSSIWRKTQCVLPYFKEKLSLGRVTHLEVDPLGLLITIQWKHLFALSEGSSISPRWRTKQLANGRLLPIELISVGVTHSPNIAQIKELKVPGVRENWLLENPEEAFSLQKSDSVTDGRVASENRSPVEIKNSENFSVSTQPIEATKADSSSLKVSVKKPRLKTKRLSFSAALADQSTLAQLAQTRMRTHQESYLQAWASLKQSHPGLFF